MSPSNLVTDAETGTFRATRPDWAAMRYFLDTEYDGFGGALLSIALVPEDGGEEFYAVIEHDGVRSEWVARHVIP